jgi:NADH-quinone oxidoreductase subunit M
VLAILSASVVILTAGYILWTIQRVFLGAEYKGPHGDHLTPITPRELAIAIPLLCFAIFFGVYPQAIFNYMEPTVTQQVKELATWTRTVHDSPTDGIRPEVNAAAAETNETPATWHAAAKPGEKPLLLTTPRIIIQEEDEAKLLGTAPAP